MGPPDTRFSWGTTWLMSWPDGERNLCPEKSLVVCLVLSLVSTFSSIFSDWKGIVSWKLALPGKECNPGGLLSLVMSLPIIKKMSSQYPVFRKNE